MFKVLIYENILLLSFLSYHCQEYRQTAIRKIVDVCHPLIKELEQINLIMINLLKIIHNWMAHQIYPMSTLCLVTTKSISMHDSR